MRIRTFFITLATSAVVLAACDDDPFAIRWEEDPDTVRLFALSRPELNLVSAFDFWTRLPVRLEAPASGDEWDLAVDVQGGEFVWLPPRSLGVPSEAGIALLDGQTFESAQRAPGDTARYATDQPLAIRLGEVYAVRTREIPGAFGSLCNYYGKVEALAIDVASGVVDFRFDLSPACNNRDLVPPD